MNAASEKAATAVPAKLSYRQERRQLFVRRFKANRLLMTGGFILAVIALLAAIAPLLTPYQPLQLDSIQRLKGPTLQHWFGTDNFGRDVFTRAVYGLRISVLVGLAVTVISSFLGMLIGLLAASYSLLDHILMRICDGLFAFPSILLAIAIMAALGPNVGNVIIALSVIFVPSVARIVRSKALVVRELTYIEALRSQGASSWRIIWLHMAPNTMSPLIIQATFIFAVSILTEAALSFLGAGIPAPAPSLGNMLYDGKAVIYNSWWMTVFPGLLLVLTVVGLNLFGDGLRDLLDPHAGSAKGGKRRAAK
ncbi:ABC transporter permease [Paenibacillus sp. NPDC058071]|uniref:ABC transporter permease n=1 Tax=Paenibacillus sp. NPDC058071 TaxID=3346326 RepID=UPI0036D870B1